MSLVTIPNMRRAASPFSSLKLNFTLNALDPRINFSRTTNATVTNSAGQITYAPHNLLTYSEQFDNAAWTKTTTTVAANAIASPVSTTTGDTLTAGGANSTTLHSYTAIAQPYTFSIYIRRRTGTGTIEITADGSTYVAKTITSDWARYDTTITPTAGTRTPGVRIVTSGDAIDAWGAQLEIGSTATAYNPTTVKNLLGYSELFDNAAWTKSNSFVQTNLLTYSEAFDNAAWSKKTNVTVTANDTLAPNGYQTADKIEATDSLVTTFSRDVASAGSAGGVCYSVYVKKGSGATDANIFLVRNVTTSANIAVVVINYDTGSLTQSVGSGATTTASLNGFYRLVIPCTSGVNAGDTIRVYACFTGFIETAGEYAYVWGAQLVQGSVAGDYRRTDAAALPVYYPNHNGVVCAEQLHGTAANGTILESYTATGGSMTFSVWMRRITGTGNVDITMDTGTTWTTQAITSDWARYSITTSPTAGARTAGVRLVTSDDVVQVFGGMVSDSASLDPYVLNAAAAPTAAAYYGARFDYDPVTLAPKGLLIEEQRQNLLLNSAIDGTNLATQNVTVTAVAHTLSFYGTGSITLSGTASATLTGTGAYPTRSTLTFTPTAGTLTLTVSGTVQYAQLEIGSFATSFIPTKASQVTRAADVATIQGSNFYSWYNQNEGTIACSVNVTTAQSTSLFEISGASDNDIIAADYSNGAISQFRALIRTNGTFEMNQNNGSTKTTGIYKYALAYKTNNCAFTISGDSVSTDTAVNLPILSKITLVARPASAATYGTTTIQSLSYYPQRLSNDVLKGLTA